MRLQLQNSFYQIWHRKGDEKLAERSETYFSTAVMFHYFTRALKIDFAL